MKKFEESGIYVARGCVLLLFLLFTTGVMAQHQKVTIDVRDVGVQEVFKSINKQTGLDFVYGALQLKELGTVTLQMRDVTVEEVMERCSIMHFRSRLIKNLSGGYQQRVGIAQAIVHKPALVVFDEPTNGLDPNQILDIRRLIQDIAKERTVILSTHILREVHAICDYLLMIEQGKLVFSGTVDQFDNYIVPSTIFLQLADAPAPEVLMQVEGVTGVEELGGQRFRISFEEAEGVLERLIEASSRNRWRLMEIRPEKSSLDDIFAALSKQAH